MVAFLVVVAFTVGIGSSTAIYTVVNSLLLKPIPYQHGERWVSLLGADLNDPNSMSAVNLDDMLEYQQGMRSFDVFGWFRFADLNLSAPGQPSTSTDIVVTPGPGQRSGSKPASRRWFREGDGEEVAVISHALWQRLGGDTGHSSANR